MASDTPDRRRFPRHLDAGRVVSVVAVWLRLALASPKCPSQLQEVLTVLLSAQRASWAAIVRRSEKLPSASLLGKKWREWRASQSLDEWETALNMALRAPWEAALRGEFVWLIADWHPIPYWGAIPPELEGEVRRGPAKNGTTHFFVYATVAVVWRGARIQVAFTRVGAGESVDAVLARLWERVQPLGCRVLGWILDKGFYAAGVVELNDTHALPYLIAVPRRGKKRGIAAVLEAAEERYGFGEARPPDLKVAYTVRSLHRRVAVQEVELIIGWEPVEPPPGKRRQRTLRRSKVKPGQRWRAVAWIGGRRNWTGKKAQRVYPRRQGVEAGYRMTEGTRGRTSSHDPAWRLVLFALSVFLQNAWVWVLTEGKRTLKCWWERWREALPFIDFCAWIVRVLEGQTGHRLAVDLPGV